MKLSPIALAVFGAALSLSLSASEPALVKEWETTPVLKTPESVLFSPGQPHLYVSNMGVRGMTPKDRTGGIARLNLDGSVADAEWITGLQAPKGLGLKGGTLYVTDVNAVVAIDIAKEAVARTIPVEGAVGLNDLTIAEDGMIYVTDAKAKTVYRLRDEKPELWLENLKGPNGILANAAKVYVLDAGGLYLVKPDKSLSLIADGMEGGTDGVEPVGDDFLVSCWSGVIYHVAADGKKQVLLDTREAKANTADIGYDRAKKVVYVPTFFQNSVAAYGLR